MKSFTLKENYIIFEVFKIFRYKKIDKQTADRQTDILFILSNIFFFSFSDLGCIKNLIEEILLNA